MTKSSARLAIRLPELEWLLARGVLRAVRLIGTNDALHQWMTNHVPLVEMNERNPFHARDDVSRLDQARHLTYRKIDLSDISGNYGFAAITNPGHKHFHLFRRRI